jgi:ParB family chromosome partitioning protein
MPHSLDPATCRPRHPAQSRIVPTLYNSIKTHGQIVPGLVRPIPSDPASPHQYEIVCGHRRHATILHLTSNGHETQFVADIYDLTDEEAFRLADIDNRERSDIADYHRAQAYAEALAAYYEGNQTTMAKTLNFPTSTLNRYLLLAALPEPIVKAYFNPDAIRLVDATTLSPLLRDPQTADRMLDRANSLAAEQSIRRINSKPPLRPETILLRLKETADKPPPTTIRHDVRSPAGIVLARGHRTKAGSITITLPRNPQIAIHEKLSALRELATNLCD